MLNVNAGLSSYGLKQWRVLSAGNACTLEGVFTISAAGKSDSHETLLSNCDVSDAEGASPN
jgi:hypothetical protein